MQTDKRLQMIKENILPVKILAESGCENAECILKERYEQVFLGNQQKFVLNPNGYILLDFGRELHGGIRILTGNGNNEGESADIRIRFGESVGEACAELGKNNANNNHSTRDMLVAIPRLADLRFGQTGFRFVRLDNVGQHKYNIVSLSAVYEHLKEKPKGYFKCNDGRVNEIYDTAKHTLFLNMQNRLWDGVKRDRLVWIGDMHPEAKGIFALYGEHPLLELGLKETAQFNPLPCWMQGIPAYILWWLAVLCDYEWYTGKWEFVSSLLEYAYGALEQIDRCVTEDGNLDYSLSGLGSAPNFFICWETLGEKGIECAERGLTLWSVSKFIEMARRRGVSVGAAENIVNKLRRNTAFVGESKVAAAIYSLGYSAEEKAKGLLREGGAKGFSPFLSSYIGDALVKIGYPEQAMQDMKDFYSGMLDMGATSFWESFDIDWVQGSYPIDAFPVQGKKDIHCSYGKHCYTGYRLSLCHGWACGPVPFLAQNVLGVNVAEAGGKKIILDPK